MLVAGRRAAYIFPAQHAAAGGAVHITDRVQPRRHLPVLAVTLLDINAVKRENLQR